MDDRQRAENVLGMSDMCPVCHRPVQKEYYFCPNCGTSLRNAPLSVSLEAQVLIYLHSIVLPMIIFITVSKWRGITYARSRDQQIRRIGIIACTLLILSTLINYYLAYVWFQKTMQSANEQMNTLLGSGLF